MSDLKEIGRNSVLLRKAQGLSQEDVAFQASRSVGCLQSFESGCANTTVDTLIRIAQALNIDPRVLGIFTRTDEEIIWEIGQAPRLPARPGGTLQICDNIVQMRKVRKWTQSRLARSSYISTARLRDVEHGCANVSIGKLLGIANSFGLTLMQLNCLAMPIEELLETVNQARVIAGLVW